MGNTLINTAVTANANYPSDSGVTWRGVNDGKGSFYASGTFDSATAKLQFSNDLGSTWADVPDSSLTAGGIKFIAGLFGSNKDPIRLRINVASGGGSLDIQVSLYEGTN